ncbi:SHOCT domain-containing protein [Halomicroarcula sp. GCM10025709]|uniref:SHOCT domain-containing protein n=1 Tax=Haloarcula TaxID=2237 RepID=UPI0024C2FDEC|nr:SHOCT domain-containing protein [Halomicroarcula sp. YJ-61-S]
MLPTLRKKKLMGVVGTLSFGLSALFAVLNLGTLVPATFVLGTFVLLPLIGILGEDFPLVEPEPPESEAGENQATGAPGADEQTATSGQSPVEQLRERYARGEIGEDEFERRLERLLETEQVDTRHERTGDREFEIE